MNSSLSETQSGWAGIRTQGTRKGTAVFKTAAFDHSATHPTIYINDLQKQRFRTTSFVQPVAQLLVVIWLLKN